MHADPLVCVFCRGALARGESDLRCESCAATFPVAEGVPVLLAPALSDQQRGQRRYFDAEFAAYDRYRPEAWRYSYTDRIFTALGIPGGRGPYLDVGVGGSGATGIEAARSGMTSWGCDLSYEGVRRAARFARAEGVHERARFVVCAAEALPFRDGAFACASAVAVLEHLDDDETAATELGRVLQPGGLLWITVPLAFRYVLPPLWPIYRRHDRKLGHKRHYDEVSLCRLLRPAGFEHVATTYTGHAVKLVQLAVSRIVSEHRPLGRRLWWLFERADLRAVERPWGALQLSGVFIRRPDVTW